MRSQVSKIIAWHPVLTDHQAYTYQELSRQSGLPIVVQVAHLEDETRRAQGWTDTRVTSIQRILIPKNGFLRYGLRCLRENREQIHIFGSAFESVGMMLLLWIGTRLGIKCYMISEPYSPISFGYFNDRNPWRQKLKTWLRPYLYKFYMLALRGGLKGIFTISTLAAQQYAKAGMSTERIFPFGYFIPSEVKTSHQRPICHQNSKNRHLKLAFVGSLIARKGLATLISAVRSAINQGADLQLDVYGPGNPDSFDFDGERIRHSGCIPFGQTQQQLSGYDLLVLPSHYDGWGVVVNEALCAGVPVLCSDQVGSRVLVEVFGAGKVFPRGNEKALTDLLIMLTKDPVMLQAMKLACYTAAEAIQPEKAAAYMLQVLFSEPEALTLVSSPWYQSNL